MRRLAALAVLVAVGGLFYVLKDVGHVPIFSANLERLAETHAEGYCAGVGFWKGQGDQTAAKQHAEDCRSGRAATAYDLQAVQSAFCQGVVASGYQGGQRTCMSIVQANRLWPTFDGGLTNSWSRNFPYPGELILQQPVGSDESRTGLREGNQR